MSRRNRVSKGPGRGEGSDFWRVTIRVPSHLKATIVQHKEASGNTMNGYLVDAIVEKSNPTPKPEIPKTAEQAAWVIFQCLNSGHQAMLQDLMTSTGTPLSLYLLSHLQLVYEQGNLSQRLAEEQVPPGAVPMEAEQVHALKEVTCDYCSKPLTQVAEGQRFHRAEVDGEDGCGALFARAAMRANRLRDQTGAAARPLSGKGLF